MATTSNSAFLRKRACPVGQFIVCSHALAANGSISYSAICRKRFSLADI